MTALRNSGCSDSPRWSRCFLSWSSNLDGVFCESLWVKQKANVCFTPPKRRFVHTCPGGVTRKCEDLWFSVLGNVCGPTNSRSNSASGYNQISNRSFESVELPRSNDRICLLARKYSWLVKPLQRRNRTRSFRYFEPKLWPTRKDSIGTAM